MKCASAAMMPTIPLNWCFNAKPHHRLDTEFAGRRSAMPIQPFAAQVRHTRRDQGCAAVIDLQGEINGQADQALNAAYAEAIADNPELVVLNFSKVDYINSTGIA